jgi:DNA gyrase/topoisomerase IV subunit B
MDYKTSNITLIEWFEAVRRRPDLYIGAEEADRSQRVDCWNTSSMTSRANGRRKFVFCCGAKTQ